MDKEIKKPIVLVGMMGSGKSHVGRLLAERLNRSFYDADKILEEEQGRSISDIFSSDGESAFREMEADLIERLMQKNDAVISTGGGAVVTHTHTLTTTYSIMDPYGVQATFSMSSKNLKGDGEIF